MVNPHFRFPCYKFVAERLQPVYEIQKAFGGVGFCFAGSFIQVKNQSKQMSATQSTKSIVEIQETVSRTTRKFYVVLQKKKCVILHNHSINRCFVALKFGKGDKKTILCLKILVSPYESLLMLKWFTYAYQSSNSR